MREGKITRAAVVQAVNSWIGFGRWASAYNLAKKIFAPTALSKRKERSLMAQYLGWLLYTSYTLVVVDRWGNRDESFPALPGVRSKAQYKGGAVVAVAMAYGDSPAIIGEVQL